MNWKVAAALGALAGGVAYALYRRSRRGTDGGADWSQVTDRVDRLR